MRTSLEENPNSSKNHLSMFYFCLKFFPMLKIKVKAGSITNLTDARYFAAREVEWLGFPIGMGEGLIEPLQVKAIAEWVDGVKIVGEFGISKPDEILALCSQIGLDTVQVGMFFLPSDLPELQNLTVIKELVAGFDFSESAIETHLAECADHCDYFLLNLSAEGHTWQQVENGVPFSADFLKSLCKKYNIILQIDCLPDEVAKVLAEIRPYALSLSGGEEEKVGVKSFDELDGILDNLEIE